MTEKNQKIHFSIRSKEDNTQVSETSFEYE